MERILNVKGQNVDKTCVAMTVRSQSDCDVDDWTSDMDEPC
jgi:hypothetical protein